MTVPSRHMQGKTSWFPGQSQQWWHVCAAACCPRVCSTAFVDPTSFEPTMSPRTYAKAVLIPAALNKGSLTPRLGEERGGTHSRPVCSQTG
ncbi:hypothetical protein OH76DRAFT_1399982 [Lentinus brumalis]|uniref:Uncharacterized protein n=1 Tax=Lentinus brumalis TaxID=2498619 RepID=A0A371DJL6_9APHY|nr:hypothetical protein OH76DRAFT_1399982 [Polyporus brumalis]